MKNNLHFKQENRKYIFALIAVIMLFLLIWLMPVQANSVFVKLYTSGIDDGVTTNFDIYSEKAYDYFYTTEGTASNNEIGFCLDYEYFSVDEIIISNAKVANSVVKMEIEASAFQKFDYVCASLENNVLVQEDNQYVFSDEAIDTIEQGLNNPWYVRMYMSIVLILAVVLIVSYEVCKKKLGKYKAVVIHSIGAIGLFMLLYWKSKGLFEKNIRIVFTEINNGTLIALLIISFFVLIAGCIISNGESKTASKWIICIYVFCLFFSLAKMSFYNEKVANTPDEAQHMGYVAYLEQNDILIPDLAEMPMAYKIYDDNEVIRLQFAEGSVCYLMHPPLYYQTLRLARGVVLNDDGTVDINVDRLRVLSMGFVFLAIAIMYYIGYTRIRKIPLLHLLYAMVCISVPMMTYVGSGVNNDSLAVLTATISFWGLLRYVEKKRSCLTYLLIAIGISATILTKSTAGIIVLVAGLIVLITTLYKEKAWKSLISWEFLVTLPIYAIPIVYYVYTYMHYGTFLPGLFSVNEAYARSTGFYITVNERTSMGVFEYICYYIERFMQTWPAIASHVSLYKSEPSWFSPLNIALVLIWIFPVFTMVKISKERICYSKLIMPMYLGTLLTVVMQMINGINGLKTRGYTGGFSSRYYICVIVMFAFSIVAFLDKFLLAIDVKEKYGKIIRLGTEIVMIVYICLLLYEDFIYFLLHFAQYI